MLGHANLDTTAIYTRVSITKLQEVHALTHPGAKLGSTTQPAVGVDDDDEEPASAEELLSRLAAEDEDEIEALENEQD